MRNFMKKFVALTLAAALGGFYGCAKPATTPEESEIASFDNTAKPYASRIGVTNWGARYMPGLGEENSVVYGARRILETGAKVIKIACSDPEKQYPLDDFGEINAEKCEDVFKLEPFAEVFSMPFETYFISMSEINDVKWADGMSEEETAYVQEEFYGAAKYLLETYRGTGKVFILQNWETDNYVRYSFGKEEDWLICRRYADYTNARQDGINRARDEFVMSAEKNVYVFGALEINKLDSSDTMIKAVDEIVPYTYCDLYTYSSYEYKDKGKVASAKEVASSLAVALGYYKSKLPKEEKYPQKMYFGDKRLAVTEFGYPDKADGYSGEWQKMVAEGHLLAMENLNLQYMVYWQLCCNEITASNASEINKLSSAELRNYSFKAGDLNGFYLLRPDGVKTYTYNYLSAAIEANDYRAEAEKPPAWK